MVDNYAGNRGRSDPRISPRLAELGGLPPVLTQLGSSEILLDDSRRVARKISAAGGQVTLDIWSGMPHVWHLFAGWEPEGRKVIVKVGRFVQAQSDRQDKPEPCKQNRSNGMNGWSLLRRKPVAADR